jgi:hypothetical protein
MKTFEVEFIDTLSNGKKCKTSISGENMTKQDAIEHFGLNNEDVLWYEIIEK